MDHDNLRQYLNENSLFHLGSNVPFHSYPCSTWDTGFSVDWEQLRNHGLIPPNYYLFPKVSNGNITEEDQEELC
jgi:hypothetical protein